MTEKSKENLKKKYYYAVGKRKTAVAQVKLFEKVVKKEKPSKKVDDVEVDTDDKKQKVKKKDTEIMVNGIVYGDYFAGVDHEFVLLQPLKLTNTADKFSFEIKVKGSGKAAQAGAVRHGIAKALVVFDDEYKAQLKPEGLLKRDARMVERKKFGKKKARRSKQWSKR